MQDALFPEERPAAQTARKRGGVQAAAHDPLLQPLRSRLPATLRLGTSSWSYPGWIGTVWDREYSPQLLSKKGLPAYAQHPLLRTVSLDRAFYQALPAAQYALYAQQVPADFRFVVKAPSLVADALIRSENGRGLQRNASFLDPHLALESFARPASEGLGAKLGVLLFQLSPLPESLLLDPPALLARIAAMLAALPLAELRVRSPELILALELRNGELLGRELATMLRACGATYCLGLHAKMPQIEAQLPTLRALWPGPLVCRWNLHRKHGAYGYEEAKRLYGNFDRLVDPDPHTRAQLARVIAGTTGAGHPAYVTLGNKAEGSAPLSVLALAQALSAAG
ncbi:Uncharacterized conserved protein YecE, DUF72 family [Solimonas aquatica]|uniref:Uncharacterized conserved protein YecE, DUF72 family n=1 Tax=Solimonas aquatica TaxID=489703 RepID=A0A1H9FML4_9GAMM|nr:DUF72 domain-containing protein [Solimonas aquatica]SEQ38578.1 Uncharacterized conserved protein YecE, DUF72 family [Solimonas aquatica]